MDVFASIFGDDEETEKDVEIIENSSKGTNNFNDLLPESLKTVSGPVKPKVSRGNMEQFDEDTHATDRHIIGVTGKNVVGDILNRYKQQMKFVDIEDEKNWWKERPVQRKPTNIYREDKSDDSDLEITGVKNGKSSANDKVKLVPGAVKGYAVEKSSAKKEKKSKKDKKHKKDKKSKKKKKKKDSHADSSDSWEEA